MVVALEEAKAARVQNHEASHTTCGAKTRRAAADTTVSFFLTVILADGYNC